MHKLKTRLHRDIKSCDAKDATKLFESLQMTKKSHLHWCCGSLCCDGNAAIISGFCSGMCLHTVVHRGGSFGGDFSYIW